jgi:hypothetical protein
MLRLTSCVADDVHQGNSIQGEAVINWFTGTPVLDGEFTNAVNRLAVH